MNRLIHAYLFLLLAQALTAQSICHYVIGSLGQSTATVQGTRLEFTVGQNIIATVGTSGNLLLTQGFHQPETCVGTVSTEQVSQQEWKVTLSPNPATSLLQLSFAEPLSTTVIVRIFDVNGRVTALYVPDAGASTVEIITSGLSRGVYLLTCIDAGHGRTFQIPFVLI